MPTYRVSVQVEHAVWNVRALDEDDAEEATIDAFMSWIRENHKELYIDVSEEDIDQDFLDIDLLPKNPSPKDYDDPS